MSDLVYEKSEEEKPQQFQAEPSTDLGRLDELLGEIKKKGEQSEKDEIKTQMHINKMMAEIENEFEDIDSLLREVESLTISSEVAKHEESM